MLTRMTGCVAALVCTLAASVAQAHVVVQPREAVGGAEQQYTVRVPVEGQVVSTSVELEIPADLVVTSVAPGDGFTVDVRKERDRIVAITWKKELQPKERAEFSFTARNPASGVLTWKAHQHFADGSIIHWVGERGTKQPASVTQLKAEGEKPAATEKTEHKH